MWQINGGKRVIAPREPVRKRRFRHMHPVVEDAPPYNFKQDSTKVSPLYCWFIYEILMCRMSSKAKSSVVGTNYLL